MESGSSSSGPSTTITTSLADSMINTRAIWRWDSIHARMEPAWVGWRMSGWYWHKCVEHLLGDLHGSSRESRLSRDSHRLACDGYSFQSRSNRLPVRCFRLIVCKGARLVFSSADIVSNHQLYRVKSAPLTRVRVRVESDRWFSRFFSVSRRVTSRRLMINRARSIIVVNLKAAWSSHSNATMMRNVTTLSRGECWTNKPWNFILSLEHTDSLASGFPTTRNAYAGCF